MFHIHFTYFVKAMWKKRLKQEILTSKASFTLCIVLYAIKNMTKTYRILSVLAVRQCLLHTCQLIPQQLQWMVIQRAFLFCCLACGSHLSNMTHNFTKCLNIAYISSSSMDIQKFFCPDLSAGRKWFNHKLYSVTWTFNIHIFSEKEQVLGCTL
jgi:hypothetical protein